MPEGTPQVVHALLIFVEQLDQREDGVVGCAQRVEVALGKTRQTCHEQFGLP